MRNKEAQTHAHTQKLTDCKLSHCSFFGLSFPDWLGNPPSLGSMMAEKLFQKPKVYDPTMADRPGPPMNSRLQQMLDLGFDDAAGLHPAMDEKCGQLAEQLDGVRATPKTPSPKNSKTRAPST